MKRFFKVLFVTFMVTIFPVIAQASCKVVLDGRELIISQETAPFVIDGVSYAPVRGVSEAFGESVAWDPATKTVYIGRKGGNPQLNEYINIFYNGKEQIIYNTQNIRLSPLLKDGATYIPTRALAGIFGKNIVWDNVNKSAILFSPLNSNESEYLKQTISNTQSVSGLNSQVIVSGSLSHNGNIVSSSSNTKLEPYSPIGFTLSTYLTSDYLSNASYLGNGRYFFNLSPERFTSNATMQKTLYDQKTTAEFSRLYIYLSTKGGYVTDVTIYFSANITYNNIAFHSSFKITALMQYPESFSFLPIPFVDYAPEHASAVIPTTGENDDSVLISSVLVSYIKNLISAEPKEVINLLHNLEYKAIFSGKSSSQINIELTTLKKKLASKYQSGASTYDITSLIYISPDDVDNACENAAKATVNINYPTSANSSETEKLEILFLKRNGKWYLDSSAILTMYK